MDEWMKKLDVVLDKYEITENREAIKDDISDIIEDAWQDGRQTGRDTYYKWDY